MDETLTEEGKLFHAHVAHAIDCPWCRGREALDRVPTPDPNHLVITRCLEDLEGRIRQQERMQQRFESTGELRNAAGCGRAIAELSVCRALLERDFREQGTGETVALARCTREQPHDGPCNGLPCEPALRTLTALDVSPCPES